MRTSLSQPVTDAEHAVLERLWLMFRHDMSEFQGGLPNPDGTFRRERLEAALSDPGWMAYLFRIDGHPVGFAIVRGLDRPVRVLNSFFVVRGRRRSGVGRAAVREILGRHPGRWEMAFQENNLGAAAFWRRVATDIAGEERKEERRSVPDRPQLPPDNWISFDVPMSFSVGDGRSK